MNQKEKDLFLQLCCFRKPNAKKLERLLSSGSATPEVLGNLFENRMAAVAYQVLSEVSLLDCVDREFRNALRNARLLNAKWNEDFAGCINFLSSELNSCGIPYALLKGAYLFSRYPQGCRTSNDVDVLLLPEDVGKVSARLKMAGFQQGYLKNGAFVPATRQQIIESKMTRGETVPFIKMTKLPFLAYLEVDLNFSLDYKNSADDVLRAMLGRTVEVKAGQGRLRTLDGSDFILHLCAHLYKEATAMPWIRMKRDMTFYKYCDLYTMLWEYSADQAEQLIARAKENRLEKELVYCLYSVNAFFGLSSKELKQFMLAQDRSRLDEVTAPAEKRIYRYQESDPVKRFFASDRSMLLQEAEE